MKKRLTWFCLALGLTIPFLSPAANPNAATGVSQAATLKYNGAAVVPGTLVIRVKPEFRSACSSRMIGESALQAAFSELGVSHVARKFPTAQEPASAITKSGAPSTDLSLIYQLQMPAAVDIGNAVRRLMQSGSVMYAEPLYKHEMYFTPNDPQINLQYQNAKINLYNAWDVWTGDTNTVIGIVDSGTDWDHPDLQDNIKYNYADPIDGIDNDADGYVDKIGRAHV